MTELDPPREYVLLVEDNEATRDAATGCWCPVGPVGQVANLPLVPGRLATCPTGPRGPSPSSSGPPLPQPVVILRRVQVQKDVRVRDRHLHRLGPLKAQVGVEPLS